MAPLDTAGVLLLAERLTGTSWVDALGDVQIRSVDSRVRQALSLLAAPDEAAADLFVGLVDGAAFGSHTVAVAYAASALFLSECGLELEPTRPAAVPGELGEMSATGVADVARWIRMNLDLTGGPKADVQRAENNLIPAIRRAASLPADGSEAASASDLERIGGIAELARRSLAEVLRSLVEAVLDSEQMDYTPDLAREGLRGGAIAVSKFGSQGPFETYVRWWIREFVLRAARVA